MCVVRKEEGKEEAINRRGTRCPVEEVFFSQGRVLGKSGLGAKKSPSMGPTRDLGGDGAWSVLIESFSHSQRSQRWSVREASGCLDHLGTAEDSGI